MVDKTLDKDWAEEIADVKPLKKKDIVVPAKDHPPVIKVTRKQENAEEIPHSAPPFNNTEPFIRKVYTSDILAASRAGLDERTFYKLKKGQVPYEHSFDLHGFTETQAHLSLTDYLNWAYTEGLRCVIIVHGKGKGYGPSEQMGIIKAQTPLWLESHVGVLAYHTTLPKHGGSGAVYVMIRKPKMGK